MHEIYESSAQWNKNGITWLREYVEANISTVADMSICAEFIDDDREEPFGHGFTEVSDNSLPLFENATVVGHCTGGYIEPAIIDGERRLVAVADGYIDELRYPKFVEWLEAQVKEGRARGSVEIIGRPERGNKIVYESGYKESGRVPTVFMYSGYAILGSKRGADPSALIVELNEKKEEYGLEINELLKKLQEFPNAIIAQNADYEKMVAELKKQASETNAVLETAKNEKDLAVSELNELKNKLETVEAELARANKVIAEAESVKRVAELNEAIQVFSEEEKDLAKKEIEDFMKNPVAYEVNSVVGKIYCEIFKKVKESSAREGSFDKNGEFDYFIPSALNKKNVSDDFSDIY